MNTTKKLKVMTVVGTRPEIIRLSRIIYRFDQYFQHILVNTGQNYDYELNEIFFKDLNIRKPDYFLDVTSKNDSNSVNITASETIGRIIINVDKILAEIRPDAILILGDTNSCMAAIPAKRRKIPVFHMEAGNRCFDQRVPEEINRRIVDHTSDINLTYSAIAREYLLREGLAPDRVIKTGSPMFEVLSFYRESFERSNILKTLDLEAEKFFVASTHREENIDDDKNLTKIINILNMVAHTYNEPVIVSTHPRTQKRIMANSNFILHPHVKLLKPLGFNDYMKLQVSARVVLSDSGTISEDSSILNFPALNLRDVHERPEGFEEACVMMTGLEIERVLQGIEILKYQNRGIKRDLKIVADYCVANVSEKVARIVQSYTDYVNRVVWKKST